YVAKTYPQLLKVDSVHYSWKGSSYYAVVTHVDDSRYQSSMDYTHYGNVIDYYESDVEFKMSDEIMAILQLLILQGTKLEESQMDISVKLDLKTNQYTLKDKYSGKEPFSVDIWLHEKQDWDSKEGIFNDEPLYDNQEDFASDAYDIIKVLQTANYPYEEVKIYSYLADGN
ncbi:MAG TPA: hypothetical protein DCY20_05955, partial [Firmicutes bacterium]|nr:hypothetical protein [Bacillota bacterium]